MRIFLLAIVAALIPAAVFAVEGELWIEGLSLPPEAVVVNSELQESLAEEYVEMMEFLDEDRKPVSIQAVDFNLAADWPALEDHFLQFQHENGWLDAKTERIVRRLMEKKGFDRELALEKAALVRQQAQAIAGGMLEFCNPERDIYLVVMDNADVLEMMQAMAEEYKLPEPQFGRFAVAIVWLEVDTVETGSTADSADPATSPQF